MSATPRAGIPYVPENTTNPAAGLNRALNVIDALLQTVVVSVAETEPPVTVADGDQYIVATGATGDWSGRDGWLARWVEEGSSWQFFEPGVQVGLVINNGDGNLYKYDGATWTLAAGIADAPADGDYYARRNNNWEEVGSVIAAILGADPTLRLNAVTGGAPFPNKQWLNVSGATPAGVGATAPTVLGSASSPSSSNTANLSGYWGVRRYTTSTSANAVASLRSSQAADECVANTTGPDRAAGFHFRIRFGRNNVVGTERFFCGLAPSAAENGANDPSSLINCIGIGKDGADTNLYFMHNDGSGTATKVDLGFAMTAGIALELSLFVPIGGGSCDYTLTLLNEPLSSSPSPVYRGTVSTNLPDDDARLYWRLWASVGGTSGSAVSVDFHSAELRYPL